MKVADKGIKEKNKLKCRRKICKLNEYADAKNRIKHVFKH